MAERKFEASMQDLEVIIKKLEEGNVDLDEALELFEEGIKLSGELREILDKAEQKVTRLTKENPPKEEIFDNPEE